MAQENSLEPSLDDGIGLIIKLARGFELKPQVVTRASLVLVKAKRIGGSRVNALGRGWPGKAPTRARRPVGESICAYDPGD